MLTQCFVWLNAISNAVAEIVLAPVAWLPGWLSATLIAAATGVLMLVIFKYTSNQNAIRRARNRIKANLLAVSLFQEDIRVGFRCQMGILRGAATLLALSLVPMLVMFIPMCLLLGQLALWYQARPLNVGEEAVVSVQLADSGNHSDPEVQLVPDSAVAVNTGPVRIPAKNMVCWNIRAVEPGCHDLAFSVNGSSVTKQIAIGEGFLPTSLKRPDWELTEILMHPREPPFPQNSPIQSIEVDFPNRLSLTSGSRSWLIYWFLVSCLAAVVARPLLKVHL